MSSPPGGGPDDDWVPHYEPPAWYTGALAEEDPDDTGDEWVPQYQPPAWYTGPLPEGGPGDRALWEGEAAEPCTSPVAGLRCYGRPWCPCWTIMGTGGPPGCE